MVEPRALSAAQRRLLGLTKRVGPGVFVLVVTVVATVFSLAATTVCLVATRATSDVVIPSLVIAVVVPGCVAPASSWLIVRLTFALADACDELHLLATSDPLTDLPNRRHFFDRAGELLGVDKGLLLVAMIDIDRFKLLNDRHGHAVGDEGLIELAMRLREAAGSDGVAARLGGDEFVMVVPVSDDTLPTAAAAIETACASFATPTGVRLTASVGLRCVEAPTSVDLALQLADTALYDTKSRREREVAR